MPGTKGYNPASEEDKEKAQAMRREGQSIADIASALGFSMGAVSGWCRGIEVKRPVVKRVAVKTPGPGKGIDKATDEARIDEDTRSLANVVRRVKLEDELEELAARRHRRERVEEMELRERERALNAPFSGQGQAGGELKELRIEVATLRETLHKEQMDALNAKIDRLSAFVAGGDRSGKGRYDIMSQALDKFDKTLMVVGSKVDGFVAGMRGKDDLILGIKLGLAPSELALLEQGRPVIPSYPEYITQCAARAEAVGLKEYSVTPESYQAAVKNYQIGQGNFDALSAKVSSAMGQGPSVVRTGKPGKALATGEPEPPVVEAESKLVTCSRCAATFDIDIAEARLNAQPGKRLFVNCQNPKCKFLLDISGILGEGVAPEPKPKPEVGAEFVCPQCHTVTKILEIGAVLYCANQRCQRAYDDGFSWDEVCKIMAGK